MGMKDGRPGVKLQLGHVARGLRYRKLGLRPQKKLTNSQEPFVPAKMVLVEHISECVPESLSPWGG